ncbi:MAG TPA: tetratricopeptide repeat protein [Devosia sp.]|jgi:tetratricopeptide (TPR) repeat protein|nr:tetratricopeptide repeat protein [Devosia sp.]
MTTFHPGRLMGAVACGLLLTLAAPAFAIDTGGNDTGSGGAMTQTVAPKPAPKPMAKVPTLAQARADIAASNWPKAIADLKLIVAASPKSADAWNLLGFSYRSAGMLTSADKAYDIALKLNPKHTGALEYQGILYIKLGKTDEARANLAKIKTICGNTTCEEYVDLAKALGM